MEYKFTQNWRTSWSDAGTPRSSPSASGASLPASMGENWDRLAEADAMWTVLSDPDKAGGRWKADEFFATGAPIVKRLDAFAAMGFPVQRGVAVDFGCGLGRVSRWLATCFTHVVGVDISPKMLALAEHHNARRPPITFVRGNEANIPLATGSADFIHSVIALQHIPRPLQELYLREFTRLARPGGHLYIQIPSHPIYVQETSFRMNVDTPSGPTAIEIHTFPREDVEALLQGEGCDMLEVFDDDSCGPGIRSHFYLVRKNS